MANLLGIPKNQTGYYVLAVLMCVFIVFPIQVPHELAMLIDSNLGKIFVIVITLNMFLSHPIIGSVGIVAAYELIKRSAGHSKRAAGIESRFIPTEAVKMGNLNKYNQFPITVEELVIKQKIPYSFNISNTSSKATYLPSVEDTANAVNISDLNRTIR